MKFDGRQRSRDIADALGIFFAGLNRRPVVYIVVVGEDPVIASFIRVKQRFAERIGVETQVCEFGSETSCDDVAQSVNRIVSQMQKGDGMIIQLPLPDHMDRTVLLDLVPSHFDIDVLSSHTYQDFLDQQTGLVPPVAAAVWDVMNRTEVLQNGVVTILGQGRLVGQPSRDLLQHKGFNVTCIDKETVPERQEEALRTADVVVTGAGVPWLVTPEKVQDGVVLIDAGTSESGGVVKGDIHPDTYEKAQLYTPVPGGIGPLAVAMLFVNLARLNGYTSVVE